MWLSRNSFHAFGIDIADRVLRAVELRGNHLHAWSEVPLPPDAVKGGEIMDRPALVAALKDLTRAARPHRFGTTGVVAALPDERCFIKTVAIKNGSGPDLETAVRTAASNELPLPFESAAFDWALLENDRAVTVAAPREIVTAWTEAIEEAGLTPYAIELEGSAVVRSLRFPSRKDEWPLAAVDIGASRTSFMLYDRGAIDLTLTIPVSGNAFTEQIKNGLEVPWEKAEELKIACGLDPTRCETKLRGLVENMLNDLVTGIRNAIRYYKNQSGASAERLHTIYLVGGGSHIFKIDAILSQKLYIKVRPGDPLEGISAPNSFNRDRAQVFATAIGCALRGLEPLDRILGAHRPV